MVETNIFEHTPLLYTFQVDELDPTYAGIKSDSSDPGYAGVGPSTAAMQAKGAHPYAVVNGIGIS